MARITYLHPAWVKPRLDDYAKRFDLDDPLDAFFAETYDEIPIELPKHWRIVQNVTEPHPRVLESKLRFISCFHSRERSPIDLENIRQRGEEKGANLGLVHARYLYEHQSLIPEKVQQFTLLFPGTLFEYAGIPEITRCIPALTWGESERWFLIFRKNTDFYRRGYRFVQTDT